MTRFASWWRVRRPAALAVAALVCGSAAPARAQDVPGFALDRFEPSTAGSAWFTNESLDLRGHVRPAAGLVLDWAEKPLVLRDEEGDEIGAVVKRQVFVHPKIALVLWDRLRLAATVPIALASSGEDAQIGSLSYAAPSGAAAGDLRLTADVRVFGASGGIATLAVGAHLYLPTGSRDEYAGDGQVRVAPRLALAGDVGAFAYAVRLGYQHRRSLDRALFQDVGVGSQLDGALAVGVRLGDRVLLGPELHGSSVLTDNNFFKERATPLELILGGHVKVARDWQVGAGVGPGLTRGLGTPKVRFLAEVSFLPAIETPAAAPLPPADRDGDGILDSEDACPDVVGVRTGDPRTNGCPPAAPPPPPDRDGDGILDSEDACPDVPGQRTDDPRTNGCVDTDADGIFDPIDACPTVPGPRNDDPAKNGCPMARVEKQQIRIIEQVKFKTGSAVILPESEAVLNAVAKILAEHEEIKKIRVEGHTDNVGTARYNKGLSTRRAASVVKWLAGHGVDKGRLVSEGFGLERPLASNDTEDGRRENRRVEFHIVDPPPSDASDVKAKGQ